MQLCPRCGGPVVGWPCPKCGQENPDAAAFDATRVAPDAHPLPARGPNDDPPAPWEGDGLYRPDPVRSAPSASEPAGWGGPAAPGGYAAYAGQSYGAPSPGYGQDPYAAYQGAGQDPYAAYQGSGQDPYHQGAAPDPYAYQGYGYVAAPRRRSRVPAILGAVVAVAAVTVGGVLLYPRLTGSATPSATPAAPTASAPAVGGSPRTVRPTTIAAPATTSAPAGAAPAAGQSGYFTFLDSLPKRHFSLNQARAMANRMSSELGRPLVLLDSAATTGMSSADYWVVGTGLSADLPTALDVCAAVGRKLTPEGDCYAKLLTFSAASVQTGGEVPETPEQECQQRGAPDVATCTAAYSFLVDYALADKTLNRSTIGDWYTEPASYYGIARAGLDEILKSVTTPASKAPNVYLGSHLSAFDNTPGSPTVRILVPYRQKSDGELGLVVAQYVLRPGGPHGFRIAAVSERDATKG